MFIFGRPTAPVELFFLFALVTSLVKLGVISCWGGREQGVGCRLERGRNVPTPLLTLVTMTAKLSITGYCCGRPLLNDVTGRFTMASFSTDVMTALARVNCIMKLMFIVPLNSLSSQGGLVRAGCVVSLYTLLTVTLTPGVC